MNLEQLARKLEPLHPDAVKRWRDSRLFADAETATLLDHELIALARRVLGDAWNAPLLSLPPERVARGPLHLGTVLYEQPKWECGLHVSEMLQGIGVFGRSGAGKTNVVLHLLLQLAEKRIPFLMFDWKRTARHLLPHFRRKPRVFTAGRSLAPLPFNPFLPPPGMESHVYASIVVDVLASAYTLGDGAKSVLQRLLIREYEQNTFPTPRQLLTALENTPAHGRAIGWHATALRALQSVSLVDTAATSADSQSETVRLFLRSSTVIELDGLNDNAKAFLVPLLFLWLYQVQLAEPRREELALVVVVEEAHHFYYRQERRSRESVMNRLLRQCRELSIGTIIVDQHAHLMSAAALGNTFATIALNQKDPADVNKVASLCLLDDGERELLNTLPVGVGIVKLQDRWRRPFVVQFPHVVHAKGLVTDDELSRFSVRETAHSASTRVDNGTENGFGRVLRRDEPLDEQTLAFIDDVLRYPDSGVKERYRRLGWTMERGTRIKNRLVHDGWLVLEIVPLGMTRTHLLRLSDAGTRLLGVRTKRPRESLTHAYWKRWAAREWQRRDYKTIIEAPRPSRVGGTVDVLAMNAQEMVAIEIETGKSRVVENVRSDLRAGYDRIVVVATDDSARKTIERNMVRAQLLVLPRVTITVGMNAAALAA